MLNIGLQGSSGRTGKLVLDVISEFPDVTITHFSEPDGIKTSKAGEQVKAPTVWIDFSVPEASLSLIDAVVKSGEKTCVLVATTGHSKEQLESINNAAKKIPILIAPNTSLGVFALNELTSIACSMLSAEDWEIHIEESHHRFKKDAPSGTAKLLQSTAMKSRGGDVSTVPTSSIRGGDIVGEHTVFLISNGERIELTHRASDRRIFARGAVRLAKLLVGKPAGLYGLTREFFQGPKNT